MDASDWKVQQGNITGTLGMPLPGTSLKVVDKKTGAELPLGQEGRVLIGGSQVMLSYLDEPDKTAAAISAGRGQRWFNTARTGHLTAEGFLVLNEAL